jgi:hypothetical protein
MAPAFATARRTSSASLPERRIRQGSEDSQKASPEPKVCSGLDESLMQVFHTVLMKGECPRMTFRAPGFSIRTVRDSMSHPPRPPHAAPSDGPNASCRPLGFGRESRPQGSTDAPETITTRPERIKEVDDEILNLGVTVLSPVGPAGP